MPSLEEARRHYAEKLVAPLEATDTAPAQREALARAFAAVPREAFAGPPPWCIRALGGDFAGRDTSDPAELHEDVLIELDASRSLNNGSPSLWVSAFAALAIEAGESVVHVGSGAGYFTAVLAELVGPTGRVLAFEVDPAMGERAARNLAPLPNVELVRGSGTELREAADVIIVNAGATGPLAAWLDALRPAGRLYLPLTVDMDSPVPGREPGYLGFGVAVRVERPAGDAPRWPARLLTPIGIYHCSGARSEAAQERLRAALASGLEGAGSVRELRRDPHEERDACWLHDESWCLSRDTSGEQRSS